MGKKKRGKFLRKEYRKEKGGDQQFQNRRNRYREIKKITLTTTNIRFRHKTI